jgi:hypothetical protein
MTAIPEKIFDSADRLLDSDPLKLRDAIEGIVALAEKMRAESQTGAFIADTILLTLAKPLGLRIELGKYAQLVDLDEEE